MPINMAVSDLDLTFSAIPHIVLSSLLTCVVQILSRESIWYAPLPSRVHFEHHMMIQSTGHRKFLTDMLIMAGLRNLAD
jgi:hypothetical protein